MQSNLTFPKWEECVSLSALLFNPQNFLFFPLFEKSESKNQLVWAFENSENQRTAGFSYSKTLENCKVS
jgi:hypothetical protein